MSELMLALVELRTKLVGFDPSALDPEVCLELVTALASTEKACGAARVRAASRVAACEAQPRRGYRDASEWLARVSGTSTAQGRMALETAAALETHPSTAAALVSGALSLTQAYYVVSGADGDADSEAALLALAATESLQTLVDAARRERLARIDPVDLADHQRKARRFRHWRDDMGMIRFRGALSPVDGVDLMHRIDVETNRHRREARAAGAELEAREAYAADALLALTNSDPAPRSRRVDVVVVVDSRKLDLGDRGEGPCHIIGGGPIPVAEARRLATDAFLKVVLHDGVMISRVLHVGRYQPAELRTALSLGDPPHFEGTTCSEPGCGKRYWLQWDHVDPQANGGATSFENEQPLCWEHHHAKTERDRAAGLLNGRRRGP